jgi:uncharacterized coiled-coil protein SlyX
VDTITELAEVNWIAFIITFYIIISVVKFIIEHVSYFKKKFRIKTGLDEDKESMEKRVAKLEEHDKWQYDEISKISQGVDDIKARLDKQDEKDKERIITECGAQLYNLHDKFMRQKYVTRAGLETFDKLAKAYLDAGGNHSIKNKIIPEVYTLEVHGGAYGIDDDKK